MFYSKSTNWFYDASINASMPDDVCEITAEEHAALMAAQADGKVIVSDKNGRPIARDPLPSAPVVPAVVTMYQARAALINAGLIEGVESAIAAMPAGKAKLLMRAAWEYAQTVERSSEFTRTLSQALSLTPAKLDELFTAAAAL